MTIYDKDDQPPTDSEQDELPLSSFKWNDVFFESMRAKYTKPLDLEFYQQLSTPTAKRVYRFLDKRFGTGRRHWDFDLREFAFQHVGMSQSYDIGKIKEKLGPAIQELEEKGFLAPCSREQRFQKHGKAWRVYFARADQSCPAPDAGHDQIVTQLTSRGISAKVAAELAAEFDPARIEKHIDIFDWTTEHHPEALTNPAGYLREAIRSDFAPRAGYRTKEQRKEAKELRRDRAQQESAEKQLEKERAEQAARERAHIKAIRANLSAEELQAFEQQAIAGADEVQRQGLNCPSTKDVMMMVMVDKLLTDTFPPGEPVQCEMAKPQ